METLGFPVVSANIELQDTPSLKAAGVKPYHIFPEYRLGVIGYISNTTADLSLGSKGIRFYNPADVVQVASTASPNSFYISDTWMSFTPKESIE